MQSRYYVIIEQACKVYAKSVCTVCRLKNAFCVVVCFNFFMIIKVHYIALSKNAFFEKFQIFIKE